MSRKPKLAHLLFFISEPKLITTQDARHAVYAANISKFSGHIYKCLCGGIPDLNPI